MNAECSETNEGKVYDWMSPKNGKNNSLIVLIVDVFYWCTAGISPIYFYSCEFVHVKYYVYIYMRISYTCTRTVR